MNILKNTYALNLLKDLPNDTIDFCLTDLPYIISKKTGFRSCKNGVARLKISMDYGNWDNVPLEKHYHEMNETFKEIYRVLKPGHSIVAFYDLWKISFLHKILEDNKFRMIRYIEWIKTNPVPINQSVSYLSNAREVALVATKGSKPIFHSKYHNGIFIGPIHRDGGKRLHPTQKPLKLMKELIEIHTNPNDLVLDPFAGSGTTLVAAQLLNRRYLGSELDKKYYALAINRLKELENE